MQPRKSDLRREPNEQNPRGQTLACDRHVNRLASLTAPDRETLYSSGCYSLVVFQFRLIRIEVIQPVACSAGKATLPLLFLFFVTWVRKRYLRFNLLSEEKPCNLIAEIGDCYLGS